MSSVELQDTEDLSPLHAVKTGTHDAISTVVQYGVIAAIVLVGGKLFFDENILRKARKRWLE